MARKKPQPHFTCTLPMLIMNETTARIVSKAVYDGLAWDRRDTYSRVQYDDRGRPQYVAVYQRVDPVPPYHNPAIDRLRNKLKRQRVRWMETVETRDDREYLHITTVGVA